MLLGAKNLSAQYEAQFILELPAVYEGPLSTVYRAQDVLLGRTVGIKEVDLNKLSRQEKNTLQSEINVWCDYASRSPYLPQIYSVIPEKSKYYIVMQWLEGKTLRRLIDEGNLSFAQKLQYAVELCEALAPIHKKRRQHRDLKPENIQITDDGKLYLIDFNISAAVPHAGIGTDGYLAPECCGISQQSGASRVDVYAIGVILYELFTDCIPIFGLDYACDMQDTDWQMFITPSEKLPELPAQLDSIIAKCMALQWKNRYPDAGSIARELKNLNRTLHNRGGKKHAL